MKKKTLFLIVTICLILLATLGVSVALFGYLKEGIDNNSIEVGDITFRYTEVNGIGHGINLEDSFPISDSEGKELDNYFEFKIDSKLSRSDILYEVVVEPTRDSTINLDGIKFCLTEVNGNEEKIPSSLNSEGNITTLVSSIKENGKIKTLDEYNDTQIDNATGKTVYQEVILKNTKNYSKNFRARMWVSEDIDWSNEGYIGKKGSFRINVYANSDTSMAARDTTGPTDTRIERVVANNKYLFRESNDENIDYEVTVPYTVNNIELEVYETNTKATSETIRINDIVGVSSRTGSLSIVTGENYFKTTVTSSDGNNHKDYVLKVVKEANPDNNLLNLGVEGYSLTPVFDKDTTSYTLTLEEPSIEITGNKSAEEASITGLGIKNLTFGENVFEIVVTPEDPNTQPKIYTITVTNERPTPPIITGGSNEWKITSPTITLADNNTAFAISGIDYYEVLDTDSSSLPTDETVATTTTTDTYQVATDGIHYIYYRTVSNNGLKSTWSNQQIIMKDSVTYTITYDYGGGSATNPVSYNVETPSFTLNNPSRTGYTFNGWTGSNGSTKQTSVSIPKGSSGDRTYTANWTAKTTTVSLDQQSGSGGTTSITATYDSAMPSGKTAPSRTGYTFGGYYTSTGGGGTQYYNGSMQSVRNWNIADATKTLYANWAINKYYFDVNPDSHIASFDIAINGGTKATGQTDYYQQINYGSTGVITNVQPKTGYHYTGYSVSGSMSIQSGSSNSNIKLQLGAGNGAVALNSAANTFTVKYAGNGATGGSTAQHNCTYDSTCTAASNGFSRPGYTFAGWKRENAGSTISADTSIKNTVASGTVTYYAQWTEIMPSSVSLSPSSVTITKGGSTNLSATVSPSNANNKTVTWSSNSTGVATVSGGTVTGVNVGKATITGTTVNGKAATTAVTVVGMPNNTSHTVSSNITYTNCSNGTCLWNGVDGGYGGYIVGTYTLEFNITIPSTKINKISFYNENANYFQFNINNQGWSSSLLGGRWMDVGITNQNYTTLNIKMRNVNNDSYCALSEIRVTPS